jgi:NADPH-dependent curcumin reductase CurA
MTPAKNRQIHLVTYPTGLPQAQDFELVETDIPAPGDGEVLVEVHYLSMDPFPRLRMRADSRVGPPLPLNEVVDGRGVGKVLESRFSGLKPGDFVAGDPGWQDFAVLEGDKVKKVDVTLAGPDEYLGLMGAAGLAAYFSMFVEGAPKSGETVVITPAAGAVGSIAGQIAQLCGARVVGIASGKEQCEFLKQELGFAEVVDRLNSDGFASALGKACGAGVDVFLDGVGGEVTEKMLGVINPHARIILLGFISAYNDNDTPKYGNFATVLMRRASVRGFLLADYDAQFEQALGQLAAWRKAGKLRNIETITDGLESTPAAFAGLFSNPRPGKQLVRVKR